MSLLAHCSIKFILVQTIKGHRLCAPACNNLKSPSLPILKMCEIPWIITLFSTIAYILIIYNLKLEVASYAKEEDEATLILVFTFFSHIYIDLD